MARADWAFSARFVKAFNEKKEYNLAVDLRVYAGEGGSEIFVRSKDSVIDAGGNVLSMGLLRLRTPY